MGHAQVGGAGPRRLKVHVTRSSAPKVRSFVPTRARAPVSLGLVQGGSFGPGRALRTSCTARIMR